MGLSLPANALTALAGGLSGDSNGGMGGLVTVERPHSHSMLAGGFVLMS